MIPLITMIITKKIISMIKIIGNDNDNNFIYLQGGRELLPIDRL
jgi:hypothetical protein